MNSDQKIGVALLIGLVGFSVALGFGRRETPLPRPGDVALVRAGDTFDSPEPEAADTPAAKDLSGDQSPSPGETEASDELVLGIRPDQDALRLETDGGTQGRVAAPIEAVPTGIKPLALVPRAAAAVASPLRAVADQRPAMVRREPYTTAPSERRADRYQQHVVSSGETLSAIAQRYYGASTGYYRIYEANEDQLSHPDDLRVGQTIRIPFSQTSTRTAFSTDTGSERAPR